MEAFKNKVFIFLLLTYNVCSCLSLEEPEKTETPTSSPSLTDESTPAANIGRNLLMDQAELKSPAMNYICTVLRKRPETTDTAGTEKLNELLINGTHLLSKQYFPDKATLLIGKMGNEKTALAKILVSDISDLHVVKSYNQKYIIHGASNLRGVQSLVPKIYQERQSDRDNTISFVDCPFYIEKTRRTRSNQIAVKYFTREFLKKMTFVKTLFMVRHASLLNLKNFDDFDILASHAVNMFRNYPNYDNSIGLIVTRLESVEEHISKDQVKKEILSFFQGYLQHLTNTLNSSNAAAAAADDDAAKRLEINQKIKFVQVLINGEQQGQSTTSKIVLFKIPPVCGPVNESQPIEEFRNEVLSLTSNGLQYSKVSLDKDWTKQFSADDNLFVKNSVMRLTRNVTHQMNKITNAFMDDYSARKFKVFSFAEALQDMEKVEGYLAGVLRFRHEKIWDMVDLLFEVFKKLNVAVPALLKHKMKVLQTFFEFEDELNEPGLMKVVEYWTSSVSNLKTLLVHKIRNAYGLSETQNKLFGLEAELFQYVNGTELRIQQRNQSQILAQAGEQLERKRIQTQFGYIKEGLKELRKHIALARKCRALKPKTDNDTRLKAYGLLMACEEQNVDGVKAYLQLGTDPNYTKDEKGEKTTLYLACSGSDRIKAVAIAKLLIKYGANYKKENKDGNKKTFLHQLLYRPEWDRITPGEFHEFVEILGRNGSIRMFSEGRADLFDLAMIGIRIKDTTLDKMQENSFFENKTGKGFDYVMSAIKLNYGFQFLSKLIKYSGDYRRYTPNNWNLYHLAADLFHSEAIDALKDEAKDLNVNQFNEDGLTPLHLGLVSFTKKNIPDKFLAVVESLVKAGANVDIEYRKTNQVVYEIAKEMEGVPEEVLSLLKGPLAIQKEHEKNEKDVKKRKKLLETIKDWLETFNKEQEEISRKLNKNLYVYDATNLTNLSSTVTAWLQSFVSDNDNNDERLSKISSRAMFLSNLLAVLNDFEKLDNIPSQESNDNDSDDIEIKITDWLNRFDNLGKDSVDQYKSEGTKYTINDLKQYSERSQLLFYTVQEKLSNTSKYDDDMTFPQTFSVKVLISLESFETAYFGEIRKENQKDLVFKILNAFKNFGKEEPVVLVKSQNMNIKKAVNETKQFVQDFEVHIKKFDAVYTNDPFSNAVGEAILILDYMITPWIKEMERVFLQIMVSFK